MSIRLHIDRLVLDGLPFSYRDGQMVQAAFEAELSSLLSQGGIRPELQHGGALQSVAAGDIQIMPGDDPVAAGKRIAGAVYSGLGNERI
jgi:hypothetical protein